MKPPILHIKVRDAKPGERLSEDTGEQQQIVEVYNGDELVGQLPITGAKYEIKCSKLSIITLTFIGGGSEFESTP